MREKQIVYRNIKTHYTISDTGIVRNMITGKIMKQSLNQSGYLVVRLNISSKRYEVLVHRLVAEAFCPNPNNLPQVNHIDGIKTNPNYKNLEWCTAKYNVNHAIEHQLSERINFNYDQIKDICSMIESGKYSMNEIANIYHVPRYVISCIKNKSSYDYISKDYNLSNCKTDWSSCNEETVRTICKLICENKLMLDEIAEKIGVSHYVVCSIYHKRSFKDIVNQYDFSDYDKYQRYDKKFLQSIQDLMAQEKIILRLEKS